ncbi:MAG: leucine-rich repeat protein [Firmicutes bacterium]|nr:leucine-rich repeat protein [Bacillota bacterium]MBQ9605344.1 leucine-rich repeat protein [Bacillota bacterium]
MASFKNTGLKEITLNEGLYTIDNETFADCTTLKTITIDRVCCIKKLP